MFYLWRINVCIYTHCEFALLGLIAKMKDTAENAAQKIQAKAESVRFKTTSGEVTIRRKVYIDLALLYVKGIK